MLKKSKWNCKNILTILVLLLFVNLPVVSALELSEISAKDITENQATVVWETDEAADSFVNYGVNKGGLQKIGDSKKTTAHEFDLGGLLSDTEYYYSVESGDLVDDNSGNYYSFKTLVPDTTAPEVVVDLPNLVAGTKTDIIGWTEIGATVQLFIDGSLAGSTVAIKDEDGIAISSNVDGDVSEEVTEDVNQEVVVDEEVMVEETIEENPEEQNNVDTGESSVTEDIVVTEEKSLPPIVQKYLIEGTQTKKTVAIEEIVANINGESDQEVVENIINWISNNLQNLDVDSEQKSTLTCQELIDQGTFSGCTDFALVFLTLVRAKNIPAIYVETIEKEFLESIANGETIDSPFLGHVFADVYIDGEWQAVDPIGGYFTTLDTSCTSKKSFDGLNGCYIRKQGNEEIPYVIYDKGLDFWDLGFNNKKEFVDHVYGESNALVGGAISYTYSEAIAGQAVFGDNKNLPSGKFTFTNVVINPSGPTEVLVEVIDASGNKGTFTQQIHSDNTKPKITLANISEIVDGSSLDLQGTISENATYEIFIENKSVAQGEGTFIKATIPLEEGDNQIIIIAEDVAGWKTTEKINVYADTQAPTVSIKIEKGNEYFQGRAVSSINGETEPGATVYLYVYRPLSYDYNPDFSRAWKKVSADQNGSFKFKNVDFEDEPVILKDLAPKLVPEGLQEYSISGVGAAKDQQRWTYYVFVIAEDQIGKQGYSPPSTITINTCYSADWDFDVRSIPEFQRPMRLDPGLLDEGREQATAVFNISYRGQGYAKTNALSGQVQEEAFKIIGVSFDKACTQGMMDDEQFRLGCNIMQNTPSRIPNVDQTAWYLTYKLNAAEELSDGDDKFWDEFKKRQIVFPMKIRINYQERGVDGKLGATKTQTSCYDLGYFVDIPIDSKNMLPDWLADEGMEAIDFTIKQIDTVLPYLQKAILVTGVGCISSFLGRMVLRWSRMFISKLEVYFTRLKDDDEKCPANQNSLYLKSTIEQWRKLEESGLFEDSQEDNKLRIEDITDPNLKTLDDLCPRTAGIWKVEAGLDQAYRWTCDRVFCRAVPAGWTASKSKDEVDTVVLAQNRCTASSRGIPLTEKENCGKLIKENVGITNPSTIAESYMKKGEFTCYQHNDKLYVVTSEQKSSAIGEVVRLRLVHGFGYSLGEGSNYIGSSDLLAYKPPNAEQFIVGQDQSCANACRNPKKPGYGPDLINSVPNYKSETASTRTQNGCYKEVYTEGKKTTLKDEKGNGIGANKFSAGYTSDCFVDFEKGATDVTMTDKTCTAGCGSGEECRPVDPADPTKGERCFTIKSKSSSFDVSKLNLDCTSPSDCNSKGSEGLACRGGVCVYKDPTNFGDIRLKSKSSSATGMLRCVCTVDEKADNTYGARTAAKEKVIGGETQSEGWIYRQAEVFKNSKTLAGTYYPTWRYYKGRDLSSAFGADYVVDYFKTNKTVAKVNPKTQFLGAYQTVCLSVIRAHLTLLRSTLEGLRNCIDQAKHTGLTDAGVCKTIFAQHVCGLMYKAIAYFFSDCSPYSMNDEKKDGGVVEGIGEVFSAGLGSIGEAMDSSISDIKADYGNAQLNQFFATGAQGFTESICMFAFGYDWPLGMDFILDSAYAVEMKTTVMVFPAERELATFNPAKGTAIYNYNVGALVLPGCEIKSADVYLKCVGPEDKGHPDIQCGAQGCDCLNTREPSGVESEKKQYLDGGRLMNVKQGSFTDLKIIAPQKVDSNYRYDHVVVDLKLGPYSNAENCFDEGYKDGKFYFPIIDTSPPAEFICQVQPTTGRYFCPEVQKLFGNGNGGYLEDPYISCYNKDTEGFDDCTTPNLFTKGNSMKAKVHVFTDGEPYCLKVTSSGLGARDLSGPIKTLAKNLPGAYGVDVNLGSVTPDLFSGATNTFTRTTDSAPGCSNKINYNGNYPTGQITPTTYQFGFSMQNGMYTVNIQDEVTAVGYKKDGGSLVEISTGKNQFTGPDLQKITFLMDGFTISGLIGSPTVSSGVCKYYAGEAKGAGFAKNELGITIKAELLMSENGNCWNANTPVKAPAYGKQQAEVDIMIRLEPLVELFTGKMHQDFMNDNCQSVLSNADEIINRRNFDGTAGMADVAEAIAIYYSAACHIVDGGANWQVARKEQICTLLKFFFNREYAFGQKAKAYPTTVTGTKEYQKINKYLNEVAKKSNCGVDFSSGGSGTTGNSGSSGTTLQKCGIDSADFTKSGFEAGWKPTNWANYVCKQDIGAVSAVPGSSQLILDQSCWDEGAYSNTDPGCPGVQLCCPPAPGDVVSSGTCSSTDFPITHLTGGDEKWAFGCIDANTARSCVKSTGETTKPNANPSFLVAGTELQSLCASTSSATNALTCNTKTGTYTVTASDGFLAIRSGAGPSNSQIGQIPTGSTFSTCGDKPVSGTTWNVVEYNGQIGWSSLCGSSCATKVS